MSENKIIDGRTGELIGAAGFYSGSGVGNANSTYVQQGAGYSSTGYAGQQAYGQNVSYGQTGNYAVGTTTQYVPAVTTSNYVAGGYSAGNVVAGNQQVVNTTVNTGK
jgi:hypothetical protein